jgi:hypothetical protein
MTHVVEYLPSKSKVSSLTLNIAKGGEIVLDWLMHFLK